MKVLHRIWNSQVDFMLSLSLSLSLSLQDNIPYPHIAAECMFVLGVHNSTSHMSSSLLLQQCPACLESCIIYVCVSTDAWIVYVFNCVTPSNAVGIRLKIDFLEYSWFQSLLSFLLDHFVSKISRKHPALVFINNCGLGMEIWIRAFCKGMSIKRNVCIFAQQLIFTHWVHFQRQ